MSVLEEQLFNAASTNVTRNVYREPYPAISPTRPELSQAGKTVLITGGGIGVGFGIARAFVRASANTVIILGRRAAVLETARSCLKDEAKSAGTGTKIITQACDVVNSAEVNAFWKGLNDQGIVVDVLVANAAKFTEPKQMLELGTEEVWSQMEMNAKSSLYFAEKFHSQGSEKRKVGAPSFCLPVPLALARRNTVVADNSIH
jgi:NAD(P)-dependent dehydrogenase (short-subunit alcohol dehydrogenase family)